MKTTQAVSRRSVVHCKVEPAVKAVHAQRSVPAMISEEDSFLSGIGSSGDFTLAKALKRHTSVQDHPRA